MKKNQWYVLRESDEAIYYIKNSMADNEMLVVLFDSGVFEVLRNWEAKYADYNGFYDPRREMIVKVMLIEK